jgi:hypothetical protein
MNRSTPAHAFFTLRVITHVAMLSSWVRIPGPRIVRPRYVSSLSIMSASCSGAPLTRTVKLFKDVLPALSLAVQSTVVVPIANWVPDFGEQLSTGLASRSSVAETAYVTRAPAGDVALTVIATGVVMTGADRSRATTVTEDVPVDELPAVSCAVHLIVLVPTGNVEPDTGPHSRLGSASRSSVTVAA